MILFASERSLDRAENIKTVYDRYDGEKQFLRLHRRDNEGITSGGYKLMVTDECPRSSPGKVLVINHGVNGIKTYGLNMEHPYLTKEECSLLTCALASSKDMVGLVASEYNLDESKVYPYGLPRTDAYLGKKKGDGNTFLKDKRAYLYAPTYRRPVEGGLPEIDWDLIDSMLTDDEILVVKPHMMTGRILHHDRNHVMEVFNSFTSTPFLIDCDVLITDYSSIMFDAQILGKPVVLFEKQLGYRDIHGMYMNYPFDYSSKYCTDEVTLVNLLRTAQFDETDIRCRNHVAGACDGHATDRVIELIRSMI